MNPDQVLALSYMPARAREGVRALFALDDALGAVLTNGREPMIGRIRLAWWLEALERLDAAPPPQEPVLQALSAHVLPGGVSGKELSAIEDGWAVLLSAELLSADDLERYARGRGAMLFRHAARLLGGESAGLEDAGARWALLDLARNLSNREEAEAALREAGRLGGPVDWPRRLRPLGTLARLADRDLARGQPWEPHGTPGRMWTMLRHRLTGG